MLYFCFVFKQIAGLKTTTCLWTRMWTSRLTAAASGAGGACIPQPAGSTRACPCPVSSPSPRARSSTAALGCKSWSFPARTTTFWRSMSRDSSEWRPRARQELDLKALYGIMTCSVFVATLTPRRPVALGVYWPWKHQTIVSISMYSEACVS